MAGGIILQKGEIMIDIEKVTKRARWIEVNCKFCEEEIDWYRPGLGWRLEDMRNLIEIHIKKCDHPKAIAWRKKNMESEQT